MLWWRGSGLSELLWVGGASNSGGHIGFGTVQKADCGRRDEWGNVACIQVAGVELSRSGDLVVLAGMGGASSGHSFRRSLHWVANIFGGTKMGFGFRWMLGRWTVRETKLLGRNVGVRMAA